MTNKEKIIATAFTGISFLNREIIAEFYKYVESKLGYAVMNHMLADEKILEQLKVSSKDDFIKMVENKE